jgi:hypothetical protein
VGYKTGNKVRVCGEGGVHVYVSACVCVCPFVCVCVAVHCAWLRLCSLGTVLVVLSVACS